MTTSRGPEQSATRVAHSQIWLLLLLLVTGCAQDKARLASRTLKVAPADPWVITNLDPNEKSPALLWNGLIGVRWNDDFGLPTGASKDGQLISKSFDIEAYDRSGEEKISMLPGIFVNQVFVGGERLQSDHAKDYRSTLDMKSGSVRTEWTQQTRSGGRTGVLTESIISPHERTVAQRWTITPQRSAGVMLRDAELRLIGDGVAARDLGERFKGLSPTVLEAFERELGNRKWHFKEKLNLDSPSTPKRIFEFVATADKADEIGFDSIAAASKAHWAKAWQTDIQIDGPVEDQQFIRSALFYLRSSIHPAGKMSVSPMGLSSDLYGGHVFWDADIWVFPALALIDPDKAKAIPEYRLRRSHEFSGGFNENPQYARNMAEWLKAGRPIGNGSLGKQTIPLIWPESQIKVPWESSVSGKETVPGPSRFQDHVTGSVHFMLTQAWSLGLVEPSNVIRFTSGATDFYLQRITRRPDGKYDLKGTMSPDENHIGDNDLYTNLIAQSVLKDGIRENSKDQVPKLHLPKDDQTFLTYDNDGLRGYKQAAAVLSIWPLQYPPAEAQAKAMMERFADKVTKNGPAMSDSVHALIWARLGEKDKAYAAWHNSWKPFVKPPFLLFSEKRSSSRTYFTTGAAGSLNAVLYGFAGIRIDDKRAQGAQWSTPLKNGKILSIAPNLPKEWRKLTLKNLTILGKKYTFEIEGDRVKATAG